MAALLVRHIRLSALAGVVADKRAHCGGCAECPIINNQLCNGHGICGYNTDSNRAACYCNVGWAGIGCDSGT